MHKSRWHLDAIGKVRADRSQAPLNHAEIAQATGLPLYRVRMSLRELIAAGLIIDQTGNFQITTAGEEKLSS